MKTSKKILIGAALAIALGWGAMSGLGGPGLGFGLTAGVPAIRADGEGCNSHPPPPEMICPGAPTPTPSPTPDDN